MTHKCPECGWRTVTAPPFPGPVGPPAFDDATLAEYARECAQIGNRMPHKLKLVALAKDWLRLRDLVTLIVPQICGACGQPWTGEKCGQAENGHPYPVCYPVPKET